MCIMFFLSSNQKRVFHCLSLVNFSYVEVNSVCNIKQEILNEGNSYELYVDSIDVSLLEMCEMWLLVK